jgi:hypothetical protein
MDGYAVSRFARTGLITMTALASTPSGHDDSYADIVERMFREFECVLDIPTILKVVNGCRRDLQGSPAGALAELTERLARHRLGALAGQLPTPPSPNSHDH